MCQYYIPGAGTVDALGEQVVCGGQGNSNHPPAPNHVLVVTDGTLGRSGALNMQSSWHGASVGIGFLHQEGDGQRICSSFSSTSSTCLSHVYSSLHHRSHVLLTPRAPVPPLLLKVKAIPALRELLLSHRALRYTVTH